MDCYQRQHHQIPQIGLTRYRSAPSSYFASILPADSTADGGFGADDFAKLFNPRASSPETDRIFARFMNATDSNTQDNSSPPSLPTRRKPFAAEKPPRQPQRQQSNNYSSQMMHSSRVSAAMETSYSRLPGPIKTEEGGGGGGNSGLLRCNSSPAGLFDSIDMETSNGADRSGEDRGNNNDQIPDFPMSPWDDSTMLSDDFIKGLMDDGSKPFVKQEALDDQKNEFGNRPPIPLSHHLSLPKSALEKLVQDSLPCKLRAKRGCATHPRSIAERLRRNKISERTRKLQELVPHMEKQTNTAHMLDMAVDYIKDLQRQVKTLSENRATCTCSARMRS